MKTKKHRENLIKMACIYYTRWAHKKEHCKSSALFLEKQVHFGGRQVVRTLHGKDQIIYVSRKAEVL